MWPLKIFAGIIVFSLFLNPAAANAGDLRELYSDHFIVIADKTIDSDYLDKTKDTAEYFYRIISQEFRFIRDQPWLWRNRAKIFVAKDRGQYLNRYKCPAWSNACVNYEDKTIFTYPQQKDFSLILSHELAHIIFREYVGKKKLPLWLDEGISSYIGEKYRKSKSKESFILLKKIINERKYIKFEELNNLDIVSLKNKPKDYVDIFYLESFSVVNFIIKEWSAYKFDNFLRLLKEGYTAQEALRKSYNFRTMEELEKKWIKFYQR